MSSFNIVNYSVRPNKFIQRSLIFEGYKTIQTHIGLGLVNYVGLGSIWFSDFMMAHKMLHVDKMISIESDDIGYSRAKFNKPFKTVSVINDISTQALKSLFDDHQFTNYPWFAWLDYDGAFDETVAEDLQLAIENAPTDTAFVVTFNAVGQRYGNPKSRPGRLKSLFGDVVSDNLSKDDCDGNRLPELLADSVLAKMKSIAASARRPGGFIPCFRVVYKDGADMVTAGGFLPSVQSSPMIREAVQKVSWPACPAIPVKTPPLTIREISVLQAQLPCETKLTRDSIRQLGFDLEDCQIDAYAKFYKYYPMYAQIAT
mgnify:CR=1 FL=1